MTTFSFHQTDLQSGAPRVLPAPMTAGALFISAGAGMTEEVGDFLRDHGRPIDLQRNIWLTIAWDRRRGDQPVGQAAFGWIEGVVVREAISVHPEYEGINLAGFLDYIGSALFGGRPIVSVRNSGAVAD